MIYVTYPDYAHNEHEYVLNVLLNRYLGLEYEAQANEDEDICFTLPNKEKLKIPSRILGHLSQNWLTASSLDLIEVDWTQTKSDQPYIHSDQYPIISLERTTSSEHKNQNYLNLDIVGASFLMLSRYEEALPGTALDQHGRFPSDSSLAGKNHFLDMPVVNIYLEILWDTFQKLCPTLQRKKRTFEVIPTHDVDAPYAAIYQKMNGVIRESGSLALKHMQPAKALKHGLNWLLYRAGITALDPFDTFNFLMDCSERNNQTSHFYFKTGHSHQQYDRYYETNDWRIHRLIKSIHERGHKIGFHPSYETSRNKTQFNSEYHALRNLCNSLSVNQDEWGGRQHYIRWNALHSPGMWYDSGLSYDSTLGFADHAGFRCGTCYAYPLYDLTNRKALNLTERPMIAMEQSIFHYMKLRKDLDRASDVFQKLKETCRFYNGQYVVLWHNSMLETPELKDLYKTVVA